MMSSVPGGSPGSPQVARVRRPVVAACVIAVCAIALTLTACGSSKAKAKTATTTTVSRTAAVTTSTAATSTTQPVAASTLPSTATTTATPSTTTGYSAESATGSLKKGDSGSRVAAMQTKLRALGYDPGPSDGKFGDKTLSAVKKFQGDKSLTVDGVAGSQTLTALDRACTNKC